MLYLATGSGKLIRVHGAYVPESDLRKVVEFVQAQGSPAFAEAAVPVEAEAPGEDADRDEMYERAKEIVIGTDRKSTRLNSSHVRISYAVFCLKKKKHNKNLHKITLHT